MVAGDIFDTLLAVLGWIGFASCIAGLLAFPFFMASVAKDAIEDVPKPPAGMRPVRNSGGRGKRPNNGGQAGTGHVRTHDETGL